MIDPRPPPPCPLHRSITFTFILFPVQYEYDEMPDKDDGKNTFGYGTRIRRKQFVEKLEKAKVDMEADLKARAEEAKLAVGLRARWNEQMRVRLFYHLGGLTEPLLR